MDLVLGVDAGGTASRAVLATRDGTVVGRGSAGPGNPTAAGPAAARSIGAAVREALGEHDPASVRSGVAGIAGAGIMADPGSPRPSPPNGANADSPAGSPWSETR